ncbi:speckle-type POZ protein A-like [Trichogramma pretiosum]|uniref:speckle-type POZ protein A-like n=1 Tax=Trichogramma pretiosum TaxID=7493 RepID=UPI0006C9DF6B|nr:speckle-type POZ protein A-like [Trichogramma pretiosum]
MARIPSKAYTRVDTANSEFTWTINNFSSLNKTSHEYLTSPMFKVDNSEKKFFLQFFPNGYQADTTTTAMFLCQVGSESFNCRCKITLMVDYEPVLIVRSPRYSFSANNKKLAFTQFFRVEDTSEMTDDQDVMIITCELKIFTTKNESIYLHAINENTSRFKCDDLFLNEKLSDVKLQTVCGKEIIAHKAILASASPVFLKMFTNDMLENKNNVVNVTDFRYEVLIEMIRYIYLGNINVKELTVTCELLGAADKYDIQGLKTMCNQILFHNLRVENAISIFKLANKYNCNTLKDEVKKFISFHSADIMKSNNVKKLLNPAELDVIQLVLNI